MASEPDTPSGSLPAHLEARVEAIIRAAEDHARSIQRDLPEQSRVLDAPRQAGAVSDDRVRRLRELSEELTERAEAMLRQFEAFSAALERATAALEAEGAPPQPGAARPPAPSAFEPRHTGRAASRAAARMAELDAARLVAIEMAVDGRARGEVEGHLQEQFSITNIDALLDDVFGEDSRSTGRPRWGGEPPASA